MAVFREKTHSNIIIILDSQNFYFDNFLLISPKTVIILRTFNYLNKLNNSKKEELLSDPL